MFCQSSTLTRSGQHLYLIGGVSHAIVQQVCYLTPKENEYNWGVLTQNEYILQRYGHTCNLYDGNLIIFGGQRGASNKKTRRIVLNDFWVYNPEKRQLDQILAKRCPDLRYGHCAWVAGDFLILYGGMNEMGEVLKDVCIMNLYQKKWLKVTITESLNKSSTPPGMWFSGMVSLFYKGRKKNGERDFFGKYNQNQNIDPFLPKHIRENEKDQDLVMEGCYMFGGLTDDNDIVNDLYILKIENSGLTFAWEKVNDYNGKPPCERCHHFMQYWEYNNSIIIHGGRNDNNSSDSVLNDLFFLQVDTLTWIEVNFKNPAKTSTPRFSHAWAIFDSRILIFGGVGKTFEMEKSLEIIELNPDKF